MQLNSCACAVASRLEKRESFGKMAHKKDEDVDGFTSRNVKLR